MGKKAFFKNLLDLIIKNEDKSGSGNISVQQALEIQKDYIKNSEKNKTDVCSPPYTEISKQLNSEKPEICRATVYYLVQIAQNETKYNAPILSVLQHFSQHKKLSPEDVKYIQAQMKKLAR